MPYEGLADAVLLLHFGVVVFVVGGLLAVGVGGWLGWAWVRARRLRWLHLAAVAFVVVQAWLGQLCPLTTLESWLRLRAGTAPYAQSFIGHWLHRLLYYVAPPWAFALAYTMFGALVLVAWWRVPPRRDRPRDASRS